MLGVRSQGLIVKRAVLGGVPCRCVQPGATHLAQCSGAGEPSAFPCKGAAQAESMHAEPEGLEPYSSKATYAGMCLGSPQVSQE